MASSLRLLAVAAVAAVVLLALPAWGGGGAALAVRQEGRVRAPELEGGRGWLNTDAPLSLAALRGKVVLLDFWTYGCINCLHVIPDLQKLEAKYARQLVVIGVHSAKFDNEKETENIRRVILRYQIEHPVVNDADFRIWRSYAVRAWPTQVLIDPAGYVVGQAAGEGHYAALDEAVGQLVEEFRKRGALDERPLKLALERAKVGDLPLAFPGKILADGKGDRLYVADSNHHRVVVTRLDGTLVDTIGTGERGARDGAFDRATFYRPQGLALAGGALYVADTSNHLIRRVDLKARTVETLAGTGEQLRDYGVRGGPARATPLSSPWDLLVDGRALYVAMAGPHQIWRLDLRSNQLSVFAGTGREARLDGPRDEAAFAQPSGLASDGRALYVADSESNIIRAIALRGAARGSAISAGDATRGEAAPPPFGSEADAGPEVRTLVGGDLFEFGDRDGRGDDVRLQHPLGLAFHDGRLYVADTYNHKIKLLDPRARAARTFAGTGRPGQEDGETPSFYEPGGLAVARGRLYVADTNNHAVRVVDLKTRRTTTLKLDGLRPPDAGAATAGDDPAGPNAEEIKVAPQRVAAGAGRALVVSVRLPEGHHLNPSAPQRYKVTVESGREHLRLARPAAPGPPPPADLHETGRASKDLTLPLRVPFDALAPGASALRVRLTLFYCREDNTGTCRIKTLSWHAPVEITAAPDAPREVKLDGKVE
ncbi:MAG TPA: thioredoxin-like domain-containing protein [Pyrinomonadaceae bacterium]|nr:thioredoxin-like domain-containing protein [Pyrinomonadaceae bacterium]